MNFITVNIKISNRHVHLTEETYYKLFNEPMHVVRNLNQIGEFESDKTVTLKTDSYEINNVKVIGPFRSYNQVEISRKDSLYFKINPPVRASGDLKGASPITIMTSQGEITENCCIISQRHLHLNLEQAKKYNLHNKDKVLLEIGGQKKGVIETFVKVSDNGFMEVHIDTDDANAFMLNNDDQAKILY